MNDVQQCTAVSVPLLKSCATEPRLTVLPRPEEEEEQLEPEQNVASAAHVGSEEDDGVESMDDDDEMAGDVIGEHKARGDGSSSLAVKPSTGECITTKMGLGACSPVIVAPPKKRAALSAAREVNEGSTGHGTTHNANASAMEYASRRRWAPCIDDATVCAVAVAVLARLRRRGTLTSERMEAVAHAALSRQPLKQTALSPRAVLLDTLRILVRVGFVARRRERTDQNRGPSLPPSYALSTYGLDQLYSASTRSTSHQTSSRETLPHPYAPGPAIGAACNRNPTAPAIGSPAIGYIPPPFGSDRARQPQPLHVDPKPELNDQYQHGSSQHPVRQTKREPSTPPVPSGVAPSARGGGARESTTQGTGAVPVNNSSEAKPDVVDPVQPKPRAATDASGTGKAPDGKATGGKYRISRKRSA